LCAMGNAPSTKFGSQQQPPPPNKPFQSSRKSRLVVPNVRSSSKKPSVLQQLILLQDWQRVLIRVNLYPLELQHDILLHIGDERLQVLPLHLVCALDPPYEVVDAFLRHFVEAAALPIRSNWKESKHSSSVPPLKHRIRNRVQEWRRRRRHRRQGSTTGDNNNNNTSSDSNDLFHAKSDYRQVLLPESGMTAYYSTRQGFDEASITDAGNENNSPSSSHSSLSSRVSWQPKKGGVLLQLSPSDGGGLEPLPIQLTETESTTGSCTSSSALFRVRWDMDPLFQHIFRKGVLFPLHIACLYKCSDRVVQLLVDANPSVALAPILGMLPIHWVAAGWSLPPLQQPPVSSTSLATPQSPKSAGPLPLLKVLKRSSPESVRVQ
jgi:hypothetical protein